MTTLTTLEIDCSTGKATYRQLTQAEHDARIAEIEAAIAAENAQQPPAEQSFPVPVSAPSFIAEEFIVCSPKPKDDPKEALLHALALAVQENKPLAEMLLNVMVFIQDADKRIKELEKK